MPKKKPRIARPDQVMISRDGEDAIIEFLDPAVATTHLTIGPRVQDMTDEEILLVFNRTVAAQVRHRDVAPHSGCSAQTDSLTSVGLTPQEVDNYPRQWTCSSRIR